MASTVQELISYTDSSPVTVNDWMRLQRPTYNSNCKTAVDSSGNVYLFPYDDAVPNLLRIYKFNQYGIIQWCNSYSVASSFYATRGVCDTSGNLYITLAFTSQYRGFLMKLDSNGDVVWLRTYAPGFSDGNIYMVCEPKIDSSGNIWICGSSNFRGLVAKFDSTGTLLLDKQFYYASAPTTYFCVITSLSIGPGDVVYLIGSTSQGNMLFKIDSSGNLVWQKRMSDSAYNIRDISVTPSDQINVCGDIAFANSAVAQFSSTGTVNWAKQHQSNFPAAPGEESFYALDTDSGGNIYLGGGLFKSASNDQQAMIWKLDSSGTGLWYNWQLTPFVFNTQYNQIQDVQVDSTGGNVVVSGQYFAGGAYYHLLSKFPTNGTGTGTYNIPVQNSFTPYNYLAYTNVRVEYTSYPMSFATYSLSTNSGNLTIANASGGTLSPSYSSATIDATLSGLVKIET